MGDRQKGKLFVLYFLYIFALLHVSRVLVSSSSLSNEQQREHELELNNHYKEPEYDSTSKFNDQSQVLLTKLEELVRNLSEIVTKLESRLSVPITVSPRDKKENVEGSKLTFGDKKIDNIGGKFVDFKSVEEVGLEGKFRDGGRGGAVSVMKYSPFWSERFQFMSAVKLDSDATCINVLPFRDYEGLSKYVAVGDEKGRIYVFLRNGDVLVEFYTMSESPITTMLSYMAVYKNESILVTGHKNGAILTHRIWEGGPNGEEWNALFIENIGKFVSTDSEEDKSSISILEVHHVGRVKYILSSDIGGKIRVFRENGTVYGSIMPTSRPLAFLKQRLLFLTETGAGSLDLRSMKVRESECEGLNHSLAWNYVFDSTERSKAYGFTSQGDLIHVLLLGDIMNFKCRVRFKKKFDMDEPLVVQAIKGYLLVVSKEKVIVFNVSTQHYGRVSVPRLLFSAGLDEIKSSFLNYQNTDLNCEKTVIPLIASDQEKLVVLGLGGGYVGIYVSSLPIFKGELNTMLWTSPVLFFLLFLFGAWHFFAKKKEALTSWGPDDPFSSTAATTGAPTGSGSSERSFIETSSRSSDMMDLRGSVLRGAPRRYGSPPRYSGSANNSFRPEATDHNPRPATVDPNFRAASELKFRGSALEGPPGFPKRRESLLANSSWQMKAIEV